MYIEVALSRTIHFLKDHDNYYSKTLHCPSYIFGTERWSDFNLAGLQHVLSPAPPSMHGNGATCPGFEF